MCIFILPDWLCPGGWTLYTEYCYFTSSSTYKYSDASTFCEDEGAQLTSIVDQAEQTFIESIS